MRIKSLTIAAKETWQSGNDPYIGTVMMEGEGGKQEYNLSMLAISNLFDCIKHEISASAKAQAAQVASAVENSIIGLQLEGKAAVALIEEAGDDIPF